MKSNSHTRQKNRSFRSAVRYSFSLVVLIGAGCSSEKRGLAELQRLCNEDAGLTIRRTVETNGYYDDSTEGGALLGLVKSDFEFIEFCESEPNIASLFDRAGCWRLTRTRREGEQCDVDVDELLFSSANPAYAEFRSESCIAVEALDQPSAQYGYYSEIATWLAENGVSEFVKSTSKVVDIQANDAISEFISYSYNDKPGLTVPVSCNNIDTSHLSFLDARLIESTLEPTRR